MTISASERANSATTTKDHSRAIYLNPLGTHTILELPSKPSYVPHGAQSLIQVKYSAINPADTRHAFMGMDSFITGYEYIGPVLAVGPDSPYKVGDVLFGVSHWADQRDASLGAHQDFMLVEPLCTYKVPEDMLDDEEKNWPQVAGWAVAAQTAIDMLFNCLGFGFRDVIKGDDPHGKAILIVSSTLLGRPSPPPSCVHLTDTNIACW
jgi:NADPH:quinone reductase-like Zn-dependent oxidoreductase